MAAGTIWLTSGPASVWAEPPPAGVVSKAAVIRRPPDDVSVSALMPEALPDAWTDSKATAASILHALSAQRSVPALPWRLIERAIGSALHSGFIRVLPGDNVAMPSRMRPERWNWRCQRWRSRPKATAEP